MLNAVVGRLELNLLRAPPAFFERSITLSSDSSRTEPSACCGAPRSNAPLAIRKGKDTMQRCQARLRLRLHRGFLEVRTL